MSGPVGLMCSKMCSKMSNTFEARAVIQC
ncbi:unnamed protein product [Amaranthus hypochondriacus]